jgi:hypothetical protein
VAASTFRAVAQLLRSTSEACGKHLFCTQRTIWTLNLHNLLVVFSTAAPRDSALLLHVSVFSAMTEDPEMTYICVNCTMYIYWLILQAWFQWANFSKIWNVFFFCFVSIFDLQSLHVHLPICHSFTSRQSDWQRQIGPHGPAAMLSRIWSLFSAKRQEQSGSKLWKRWHMWNNVKQCETMWNNLQ